MAGPCRPPSPPPPLRHPHHSLAGPCRPCRPCRPPSPCPPPPFILLSCVHAVLVMQCWSCSVGACSVGAQPGEPCLSSPPASSLAPPTPPLHKHHPPLPPLPLPCTHMQVALPCSPQTYAFMCTPHPPRPPLNHMPRLRVSSPHSPLIPRACECPARLPHLAACSPWSAGSHGSQSPPRQCPEQR